MVHSYLSEPLTDYKNGDPLKWWYKNKVRYPFLAKCSLSAPLTNVSSETLFSGVGIIYDEQRSC